jgi:hypothetical protein
MLTNDDRRKILVAHLKEAERLFKNDDYFLTTIYSNRILSDSFIMDELDWGLVGFMIRSMSMDYTKFKTYNSGKIDSQYISEVRTPGVEFLTALIERSVEDTKGTQSLWDLFVGFKNAFRRYQHLDSENASYYSDNSDENYTAYVSKWMSEFLGSSKDYLYLANNNLLKGIGNEIERISNLTGYNLKITLLSSCIMSMDWYLDFVKQFGNSDPKIYEIMINEGLICNIDRLSELMARGDLSVEDFSNLIWENLKNWRKLFMVFIESPSGSTQKENKVVLPPDFRNRLTHMLSKSVKKEMGLR